MADDVDQDDNDGFGFVNEEFLADGPWSYIDTRQFKRK